MKIRAIKLPVTFSEIKRKTILMLACTVLSMLTLSAQPNKVDGALHSFLNSEFMVKMNDMKIEAEAAVRTFKQQSMSLDPEAVKRVRIGYDQTATRFNQVLTNIKADFLNPKKLKFISKFPDDYLKGLELELYQLSDFYAVNFQQPLADAQADNVDGGAIFLILSELIGLTKGLFSYFGEIRKNARQYNDAYLLQHFYKPYRMRLWDEVNQGGVDAYNNYNNYSDPSYMNTQDQNLTYPDNEVPFPEINLQSLDNLNQTDPNQPTETYDEWLDVNETDPNQQQSSDPWMEDPNFQPGSAPADSTKTNKTPVPQAQKPAKTKPAAKPAGKKKKKGNG